MRQVYIQMAGTDEMFTEKISLSMRQRMDIDPPSMFVNRNLFKKWPTATKSNQALSAAPVFL